MLQVGKKNGRQHLGHEWSAASRKERGIKGIVIGEDYSGNEKGGNRWERKGRLQVK
jgi:hypothetical protein